MNREMLKKTAERLRNLPNERLYDQDSFGHAITESGRPVVVEPRAEEVCGTACCIAGWACIAAGYKLTGAYVTEAADGGGSVTRKVSELGRELLGLDSWEAGNLFDAAGVSWPGEYRVRYNKAHRAWYYGKPWHELPSKVAADLLDALADGKATLDSKYHDEPESDEPDTDPYAGR